jgi:hypothetical protein
MTRAMGIACGLIFLSLTLAHPNAIKVNQVKRTPVIDGVIGEEAWKEALHFTIEKPLRSSKATAKATAMLCFTSQAIYIGFVCEEPEMKNVRCNITVRDGEVWRDDCVEVFIAPCSDEPSSYYHLLVNASGVLRDEFWRDGEADVRWESKAVVKTKKDDATWSVELMLPIASLDRLPIFNDRWRVNFARERYAVSPAELTTWMECVNSFHEPERFGEVVMEGISKLDAVVGITRKVVQAEVKAMLAQLRKLRASIPRACKTEKGKELHATLNELERKLSGGSLEAQWRGACEARHSLSRLKETAEVVRLIERLNTPYAIFAPSPMLKFRQDQVPDMKPCTQISMHAGRGEAESAQLLISALAKDLKGVRVSVSPLIGPGNRAIFADVRLVGYVKVNKPTPYGFKVAGRYPDPLMQMQPFDVSEGNVQAVWITVSVPKNASAGEYVGSVIVSPENAPKSTVEMRLRVYDVELPTQSFLRTCVLIWDGKAKAVYGDAWTEEMRRRFYEMCLRYRWTPPPPLPWDKVFVKRPDGTWEAVWDEFDREVQRWMAKGATAFSISRILRWGTKLPPLEERSDVAVKLRLLGEHLRERGWSDRFYFYVFDEPSEKAFEEIQELCKFIHEQAPNLLVLLTAGYGATGSFRAHAPTPDGAVYRKLAGCIGIWVPHIDCFDEVFLKRRKAVGEQVWMYVCISTCGSSYPDMWRIDWTGVSHRAVGWWLWRYECDGFLYWCVNYWTDDKGKPFNLFEDATAYPGGNGDGFLFYPDPKFGDPLPSIRAELFRDGIEDYDLLCMLKGKLTQVASDAKLSLKLQGLVQRARKLVDVSDIITSPKDFSNNPHIYEERHRAILEVLEQLGRATAQKK